MNLFPGLALALSFLFSGNAARADLSYQLVDAQLANCRGACPKIIVATGHIGEMEGHHFAAFMEEARRTHPVSAMLVIDSPGGFNAGAFHLGLLVRHVKMTVVVGRYRGGAITATSGLTSGTCASACVLVLSGGASRFFVPGSRVGVHRAHTGPDVRDPITRSGGINGTIDHSNIKSAYNSYFRRMGVGGKLADIMDATPANSMHWLSENEMASVRLARNVNARNPR